MRMLLLFQLPFSLTQSPASNMPLWHASVWCLLILPQTDCSSVDCLSHETFVISTKMAFAPVSLMSYRVGTLSPSPGLQTVSLPGPPLTPIGNAEREICRECLEFGVLGHGRLPQPWFFVTGRKVATRGKNFRWLMEGPGILGAKFQLVPQWPGLCKRGRWRNEEAGNRRPGCEFLNAQRFFGMCLMFSVKNK